MQKVPIIQYQDLISQRNLNELIEKAYGNEGLGTLFVQGIPQYQRIREKTLKSICKLAEIPSPQLQQYERPDLYFTRGWSSRTLQNKQAKTTVKGSYYYIYPFEERFEVSQQDRNKFTQEQYKLFTSSNQWVQECPQIEQNAKQMTNLMFETGLLVARKIDSYLKFKIGTYSPHCLHDIIKNGRCHMGRLLHYFPFEDTGDNTTDWCKMHNDSGALTALASALYTNQDGEQYSGAILSGGLHIRTRQGDIQRVKIPANMLAFQLGQTMRILSGGLLQSTPHSVGTSKEIAGKKVGRNTIALFMQPNPLHPMSVPLGMDAESVTQQATVVRPLKQRWANGMEFKEFHTKTLKGY